MNKDIQTATTKPNRFFPNLTWVRPLSPALSFPGAVSRDRSRSPVHVPFMESCKSPVATVPGSPSPSDPCDSDEYLEGWRSARSRRSPWYGLVMATQLRVTTRLRPAKHGGTVFGDGAVVPVPFSPIDSIARIPRARTSGPSLRCGRRLLPRRR